jgi:AcrR family transcriptional regulator
MSKKTDPRILRTLKLIQEAVLSLLSEKSYADISISDIAERAGVARPTFYLHYRSKDEVIVDYLDGLFNLYLEEITPDIEIERGGVLTKKLFEQVENNAQKLRPLLNEPTANILMNRFRIYITYVSKLLLEKGIFSIPRSAPRKYYEFLMVGVAGYFYSVLIEWLKQEMPYSPEEMSSFLIPFINQGLSGLNSVIKQ